MILKPNKTIGQSIGTGVMTKTRRAVHHINDFIDFASDQIFLVIFFLVSLQQRYPQQIGTKLGVE